jgi:hypothetical protein
VDAIDADKANKPPEPVKDLLLADDGRLATIRCVGPEAEGLGLQLVELERPGRVRVERHGAQPLNWWYAGEPERHEQSLVWPDGTRLTVSQGVMGETTPNGHLDKKVHFGGMAFADPHPFAYPALTVEPADGVVVIEVDRPAPSAASRKVSASDTGDAK